MNKIVVPTILILILTSVICVFIASEYSDTVRARNEAYNKLNGQTAEVSEETASAEESVVSQKRLTAEDTCILTGKNIAEIDNKLCRFFYILYKNTRYYTLLLDFEFASL